MVSPNDPVPCIPDPVVLLKRFVALWDFTWKDPNDPSHAYIEFYQHAKFIIATENSIQEDIATWLLNRLDDQWNFDNEYWGLKKNEIDPQWAQLHSDIAEFLPGI